MIKSTDDFDIDFVQSRYKKMPFDLMKSGGKEHLDFLVNNIKMGSIGFARIPKSHEDFINKIQFPFFRKRYIEFGLTDVETDKLHRNKGICSYLILNLMLYYISNERNITFGFWAQSTSVVIDGDLDKSRKVIYGKILPCGRRQAYRLFPLKTRRQDIRNLEKQIENLHIKIS